MKAILDILKSAPASLLEIDRELRRQGVFVENLQSILDGMVLLDLVNLTPTKGAWRYNTRNKPKQKSFRITSAAPLKAPKPKHDLQAAILAVLDHDAPSSVRILHRVTCYLHLRPFELTFNDIRSTLYQMQDAGLVKYMAPTETTEGGWYAPRKPKVKR